MGFPEVNTFLCPRDRVGVFLKITEGLDNFALEKGDTLTIKECKKIVKDVLDIYWKKDPK